MDDRPNKYMSRNAYSAVRQRKSQHPWGDIVGSSRAEHVRYLAGASPLISGATETNATTPE